MTNTHFTRKSFQIFVVGLNAPSQFLSALMSEMLVDLNTFDLNDPTLKEISNTNIALSAEKRGDSPLLQKAAGLPLGLLKILNLMSQLRFWR